MSDDGDDHYDPDNWEWPPPLHPGRELATKFVALVLVAGFFTWAMWKLFF